MYEYFAFEGEDGSFPLELGVSTDYLGRPISPGTTVYPVLLVLPMGGKWSMHIVQRIHEDIIATCGFDRSR